MKTSRRGQQFIIDHEGEKLTAYHDGVGVLTIGIGHTSDEKYPVKRGMKITRAQSREIFAHDMSEVERAISAMVVPQLNGNQYGAVASLILNIGVEGFRGSTVRKLINKGGSKSAITRAFGMWVKGGNPKREIAGLVKRRADEAALYFTPAELGKSPVVLPKTGKPTPQIEEARGTKGNVAEGGDGTLAVQTGTGITGTGAVADVVRDQADQLSFVAYYSDIIQYVVIAMVMLGVSITFYGLYKKFKDK